MQVGPPQEEIENNFKLLNSQLGGYLIKAIRNSSPLGISIYAKLHVYWLQLCPRKKSRVEAAILSII